MATYVMKYLFDPGSGVCLWSNNEAARNKCGYAVDHFELPIDENFKRRISYLITWYDTFIDWSDPANVYGFADGLNPSKEEIKRFWDESGALFLRIQEALGTDFQIMDDTQ